jgi:hypothetical protein
MFTDHQSDKDKRDGGMVTGEPIDPVYCIENPILVHHKRQDLGYKLDIWKLGEETVA